MNYTTLGNTGLRVSRICLGCMSFGSKAWRDWVLTEEESRPFIKQALEKGINFFDTADMYSNSVSEEILGRAIKDFTQRQNVILATKVFFPLEKGTNNKGLSRKHIMDAIDASLKRLGTEYIDLYQIHRWDYEIPIEETMQALHDLVQAGKVRHIGASSMFAYQLATANHVAEMNGWTKFVSMQNHYNLVYREEEREMMPFCNQEGIGVIPWSPLARGFLAGARKRDSKENTAREKIDTFAKELYYQEGDYKIADRVVELAKKRSVPPAQIALAWLLHQKGVSAPIVGVTKIQHLDDAVHSPEIILNDEERKFLEELYTPHPVLGHR